ncbi:MAG: universal stress protein [Candidatus Atribacteria bacterium]|nr:universal stress protein [Candidatus Atribacteria bacterium]
MKIQHILVPTDFSQFSDLAIKEASFFCQVFGARLTLMHVFTMAEVNALTSIPGNPWENVVNQIQSDMKQQFMNNCDTFQDEEKVSFEVSVGEPAEEVVKHAEENSVDLIVMGTHGRTGIAGIFLGSVAVEMIKKTCIPITVVKCAPTIH